MKKILLLAFAAMLTLRIFSQNPVDDKQIIQIKDTVNGTGTVTVFKTHYTYSIVYMNYLYPPNHEELDFTGSDILKHTMEIVKKLYKNKKTDEVYKVAINHYHTILIRFIKDQVVITPRKESAFLISEDAANKILNVL